MKLLVLAAAAALVLAAAPKPTPTQKPPATGTGTAPEHREQTILKGRSSTIALPFTPGVGVNSSPDVVEGKVDGKNLLLFGRAPGWATYIIYSKDKKRSVEIEVVVSDRDVNQIKKDLENALQSFEQVTVRIAGDSVIVEGEVATVDELEIVSKVISRFEGVQNQVAPSQ